MSRLFIKTLLVFTFTVIFISCAKKSQDINTLLAMMTGSFSSHNQAQVDTNFADIRLQMVQIWKDRSDGFWLYVEQAEANKMDQPYRQRIYNLSQINDSTFQSAIFTIENPLQYAGEWNKTNPLSTVTPEMLSEKERKQVLDKIEEKLRIIDDVRHELAFLRARYYKQIFSNKAGLKF